MRLRGDHWHLRLMGCLFGIGALAIGLPALWGDASGSPLAESERFDFGLIATVTGLVALIGSLITLDIRGLWYCNPERSQNARLSAKEAAINLASLKPEDFRMGSEPQLSDNRQITGIRPGTILRSRMRRNTNRNFLMDESATY